MTAKETPSTANGAGTSNGHTTSKGTNSIIFFALNFLKTSKTSGPGTSNTWLGWMESLEKDFDKAFVDLDLLLGEVRQRLLQRADHLVTLHDSWRSGRGLACK